MQWLEPIPAGTGWEVGYTQDKLAVLYRANTETNETVLQMAMHITFLDVH